MPLKLDYIKSELIRRAEGLIKRENAKDEKHRLFGKAYEKFEHMIGVDEFEVKCVEILNQILKEQQVDTLSEADKDELLGEVRPLIKSLILKYLRNYPRV